MMTRLMLPALFLMASAPALAGDADWAAISSSAGWESQGSGSHANTGSIDISTKNVGAANCVRGLTTVQASADKLLEVVMDLPTATRWSTAGVDDSVILGTPDGNVDYYQHLNVPAWTMASDRHWFLRGRAFTEGQTKGMLWDRFDADGTYPEVVAQLRAKHDGAVEPTPNFGKWSFTPTEGGTQVEYKLCSASGSIPQWVQRKAAASALPATIGDVAGEALRR